MIRSVSLGAPHQTAFSNGESSAVADVPREKGGEGQGFGPHELLEAALATCMTMTVRMHAAKHGIPVTGAGCEVRIDRSVSGRATLHYSLTINGPLSDDQRCQLREAADQCPVARTLTGVLALEPAAKAG
jgi:putative redox protein